MLLSATVPPVPSWWSEIDWGDAPTWVGVTAAVVAGLFAFGAYKVERDREARVQSDRRADQASALIRSGLHPKEIQVRLGHTTISETMETCGHLFPDSEESGRGALDGLLRGAGVPQACPTRQRRDVSAGLGTGGGRVGL